MGYEHEQMYDHEFEFLAGTPWAAMWLGNILPFWISNKSIADFLILPYVQIPTFRFFLQILHLMHYLT